MEAYRPLDCDLHDYVEIACLYRYRLQVTLLDGNIVEAEAVTTRTNPDKQEFLVLDQDSRELNIRLDQIRTIQVLTPSAKFERVVLRS